MEQRENLYIVNDQCNLFDLTGAEYKMWCKNPAIFNFAELAVTCNERYDGDIVRFLDFEVEGACPKLDFMPLFQLKYELQFIVDVPPTRFVIVYTGANGNRYRPTDDLAAALQYFDDRENGCRDCIRRVLAFCPEQRLVWSFSRPSLEQDAFGWVKMGESNAFLKACLLVSSDGTKERTKKRARRF